MATRGAAARATADATVVAGVRLSHPDRLIYPELGVSKADLARDVAETIVATDPKRFTITFSKQGRERKILIDYLRNNRTNTSICAFSPRATHGAPVSTPIAWEELRTPPDRYTLESVPRRLARRRADPWAGYWTGAQDVPAAAIEAVRRL